MSVLKKQKNLIGFLPPSILSFLFLSLFSRFASLLLGINLHPFPPSPLSVHLHAKHSPQNCPSSRPWLLIVWLYIGFRPQPHGICNTHVVCAISAFPIFFQAHNSLLFSGVGMQVSADNKKRSSNQIVALIYRSSSHDLYWWDQETCYTVFTRKTPSLKNKLNDTQNVHSHISNSTMPAVYYLSRSPSNTGLNISNVLLHTAAENRRLCHAKYIHIYTKIHACVCLKTLYFLR